MDFISFILLPFSNALLPFACKTHKCLDGADCSIYAACINIVYSIIVCHELGTRTAATVWDEGRYDNKLYAMAAMAAEGW